MRMLPQEFRRAQLHGTPRARVIALVLSFGVLLSLAACHPVRRNVAHVGDIPSDGYRFASLDDADPPADVDPDRAFVIVTFSGGGTRAAAFAYGAMEALRDTDIGNGRTMLDELDVISSVSGGSFAAAYYGLFGRSAFFEHFPNDVLFRSIETDLLLRLSAPWNWPALALSEYSRGTLAADYYDEQIFARRTYADMSRHRPLIMINATDLGRGQQFRFVQDQFDSLCSDLDPIPVGYAVFASSAFPVAFPPLTLRNFVGQPTCSMDPADPLPPNDFDDADRARAFHATVDARSRPYLHLADGGLSDNLGVGAIDGGLLLPSPLDDPFNRPLGLAPLIDNGRVKHLVLIVVDARTGVRARMDTTANPPSVFTVLDQAVGAPMSTVSANSVTSIRRQMQAADHDEFEAMTRPCRKDDAKCERDKRIARPGVTFVHISLDLVPDDAKRDALQDVGTRLQLPQDRVLEVVEWGRRLLLDSDEYKNAVTGVSLATTPAGGDTPDRGAVPSAAAAATTQRQVQLEIVAP